MNLSEMEKRVAISLTLTLSLTPHSKRGLGSGVPKPEFHNEESQTLPPFRVWICEGEMPAAAMQRLKNSQLNE